jgi:hypothetical protein
VPKPCLLRQAVESAEWPVNLKVEISTHVGPNFTIIHATASAARVRLPAWADEDDDETAVVEFVSDASERHLRRAGANKPSASTGAVHVDDEFSLASSHTGAREKSELRRERKWRTANDN